MHGTIFKGQGTQSRTSGTGVVLEPGKETLVDVFCVHASHRISLRSGFSTLSHVVPRKVENALLSPSKSQTMIWGATAVRGFRARVTQCPSCGSSRLFQNYEAALVCMQCGHVIAPTPRSATDNRISRRIRVGDSTQLPVACSARDNLVANLDEMTRFNQEVEKMLSKIPADLDNQVGVVIIDSHGVLGLEMFDHPDSWRAFSRSIVRNYAGVLAKERAGEGLFDLKTERIPQAIKKFLEKAENLSETLVFKNKICETNMFSGELIGEYTAMASNAIHLLLKSKTCAQA